MNKKIYFAKSTFAVILIMLSFVVKAQQDTIQVVFHILHRGGSENIGDSQVVDAMRILNEDFNRQNADTALVVPEFKNMIGNANIFFELATTDPMGNPTTGIERIYTSNAVAPTIDSVYLNQWNPAKYLNIWSVSDTYLIPYQFEFMPLLPVEADSIPERDGVVILSKKLGSIGIAKSMTSRSLTHYVGHYLNLVHLWGNKVFIDGTCGDDGVNDTPITKGFNYICPLYDSASVSSCTPGVVENVQNFMEYSYCSRMFTHGQVQRMKDCLQSSVANRNQLALFKVTSIKNTENAVALWVAPNPFKDKVRINGLQEGVYSVEVFNVVGQRVINIPSFKTSGKVMELDLSSVTNKGVYFLLITDKKNRQNQIKLVKE